MHLFQQLANLGHGQDNGQPAGALGNNNFVEPGQFGVEDHPVQEQDGRLGLRLGGRGHPSFNGKMRQESRNLGRAHLAGVPLVIEDDETPNPVHVGAFCPNRVVAQTDFAPDAVKKLRLTGADVGRFSSGGSDTGRTRCGVRRFRRRNGVWEGRGGVGCAIRQNLGVPSHQPNRPIWGLN